jgi:hypothetical protein
LIRQAVEFVSLPLVRELEKSSGTEQAPVALGAGVMTPASSAFWVFLVVRLAAEDVNSALIFTAFLVFFRSLASLPFLVP